MEVSLTSEINLFSAVLTVSLILTHPKPKYRSMGFLFTHVLILI